MGICEEGKSKMLRCYVMYFFTTGEAKGGGWIKVTNKEDGDIKRRKNVEQIFPLKMSFKKYLGKGMKLFVAFMECFEWTGLKKSLRCLENI